MNSVITDFNARVDSVSKMLSHIEEVSSVNGNVDIMTCSPLISTPRC